MPDSLQTEIQAQEQRLFQPEVRHSFDQLDRILAPNFVEFRSTGHAYNRQAVIKGLIASPDVQLSVEEFKIFELAPNVVLTTYREIQQAGTAGQQRSLRSSIWVRESGVWRLTFHQGTPMGD
jgi:hypothetical protein